MRNVDLKPLEEIFRAKVLKMLKKEGKIDQEMISELLKWKHSGFGIDNGIRIEKTMPKAERRLPNILPETPSIRKRSGIKRKPEK